MRCVIGFPSDCKMAPIIRYPKDKNVLVPKFKSIFDTNYYNLI